MLSSFQLRSSLFRPITVWLNRVLVVLYLLLISSLVLQYGYYLSVETQFLLRTFDSIVIAAFIAQQLLKLLITRDREAFFHARRIEYLLSGVLVLCFLLMTFVTGTLSTALRMPQDEVESSLMFVIQAIILIAIGIGLTRYNYHLASLRIHPALLFLASFIFVILLGTLALLLPRSTIHGISLVNALFTSASAVCVTGLVVVDTATAFTPFGKIIILILIQIGGLGLMTVTTFFTLFSGSLSIKEHVLMREFLNQESIGEIRKMLRHIILFTFAVECIGAIFLGISWLYHPFTSLRQHVFTSVFHSISAFCNAGFSTFSLNLAERDSAMNLGINLTITSLIIIGGIGFLVTRNVFSVRFGSQHYRLRNQLTVHTKLVLISTFVLIVAGTVFILLLDYFNPGTLQSLSFPDKILASYFQSVSTRTAGFNTLDTTRLSVGSSLIMILWMFIGASPGSTGGGIKTTTAAVIVLSVYSMIRGKSKIEFAHRHIPSSIVERAFVTLSLALLTLGMSAFFLAFLEPFPLIDILFECSSALGTVGLSRGITMNLTDASKLILTATMLIGRVGALTILTAVIRQASQANYDYPSEQIVIG